MNKLFHTLTLSLALFALILPLSTPHVSTIDLPQFQEASPTLEPNPVTSADLIGAVNTLRLANGLTALNAHPVLMQVAQTEANGIAYGAPGHWRPEGLTLGQWLISLGYPLSGDLSQDGYRSENWFYLSASTTVDEIISSWQGDAEHRETMFSVFRSDIGAGIALGPEGEMVAVLETALQTSSGLMQSSAYALLTGIPQTQAAYSSMETQAAENGVLPQYSVPVVISTARPDGDVVHEVRYGQTLWSLAIQYKVSIEQIKRLNNLADDTIAPGWKLLIQKAATRPPPPTPTLLSTSPIQTSTPFHLPTWTPTPSLAPAPDEATMLVQSLGQNQIVVAALIISFSVLVAGMVGGRKK